MRKTTAVLWIAAQALILVTLGCSMDSELGNTGPYAKLTITLRSSNSPQAGDKVSLSAQVSDTSYLVKSYSWSIFSPDSAKVKHQQDNASNSEVSFITTLPGDYSVRCVATLEGDGGTVEGTALIPVEDPKIQTLTYTARIIPPSTSGLPPADKIVNVGTVDQQLSWVLDSGKLVNLSVTDGAQHIPASVRLLRPGNDPLPRDVYLAGGKGQVRVSGVFHALFFPLAGTLAPTLKSNISAAGLGSTWAVKVDAGALIQGIIQDAAGALAGARVSLHIDAAASGVEVPSTVGTTSATGVFSLRGRAGKAKLTVVPPASSGLPVAVVSDPKLQVTGDHSGWAFTYASSGVSSAVKISGKVSHSDGKTIAPGATVVMTTTLGTVGTLKTGAGTFMAQGRVRKTLVADSAGGLQDPQNPSAPVLLPPGTYVVEVWPGAKAAADQGYSRGTLSLSGTSAPGLDLRLASRAKVTGKVLDQASKPVKARITATGHTGSTASFSALTDKQGSFALALDNWTTYTLVVRALGNTSKISSYIDPQFSIPKSGTVPAVQLPLAVTLSGTVKTSGNLGLKGALIRIWCSGGGCASKTVVDVTSTLADGTFELRVPRSEKHK